MMNYIEVKMGTCWQFFSNGKLSDLENSSGIYPTLQAFDVSI
jgi:hypothetical protein